MYCVIMVSSIPYVFPGKPTTYITIIITTCNECFVFSFQSKQINIICFVAIQMSDSIDTQCNILFFPFISSYLTSYIEQDRVCGFWTWLFVLSKLPELGDTIFIVLRKQPLIFLHWYHHITVLIYSWFSYTEYTSSARWFIVMNYCVHSVMYSYFALRAMRYRPPRVLSMLITSMQLTQMIIGCYINLWAYDYLKTAPRSSCHISQLNIQLSIAMYFSYFVLFARFFYTTYLATNARKGKSGSRELNGTSKPIESQLIQDAKEKIH